MPQYQFGPEFLEDWDLKFEDFEDKEEVKDLGKTKRPAENEPEIAEAG